MFEGTLFGKSFAYWLGLEEEIKKEKAKLGELENTIQRQRGVIESQDKALIHWRAEADKDAGAIVRLNSANDALRKELAACKDEVQAIYHATLTPEAAAKVLTAFVNEGGKLCFSREGHCACGPQYRVSVQ